MSSGARSRVGEGLRALLRVLPCIQAELTNKQIKELFAYVHRVCCQPVAISFWRYVG